MSNDQQLKTNIIAEVGINHNGDMDIAKNLISIAKIAGCQYVKIQKRNPDICVPEDQKHKIKSTPWGDMTYLDYKKRIEFDENQIRELIDYASNLGITFFASVWDKDSVDIMKKYNTITKIPSALITDLELCKYARDSFENLIISTGMSTEEEIEKCVESCNPDVIMHTNSTYPCSVEDLNLNYITWLKEKYKFADIGYSGHEYGLVTTFASVLLGASWVERHITMDHSMWGSDHTSSLEPSGLLKLVKGIRDIEKSLSLPIGPRQLLDGEKSKRDSLRK
jgi:N-acetylneuraminate synthase